MNLRRYTIAPTRKNGLNSTITSYDAERLGQKNDKNVVELP